VLQPQMYLTLPLPVSKTVGVDVVVVRADGSEAPVQCSVDVPKTGTFKHLYQAVAKARLCQGDLPFWQKHHMLLPCARA